MIILDKVHATFEACPVGEQFSRAEIIRRVNERYGAAKGSIIPSDYCYNLVNKDKLTNPALFEFNIFKHVDSKKYIYYGKNYRYNGPVFHKIDGRYEKVGDWVDGVRFMSGGDQPEPPVRQEKVSRNFTPTVPNNTNEVSYLWNQGSKKDWDDALDHYWRAVSSENMELERVFESLNPNRLRGMRPERFYQFLHDEYFVWKYTAKNRLATTRMSLEKYRNEERMDELAAIHRQLFSFEHEDIERGLSIVKQILGLGTAGASGLLAVLFPTDFGTVDQFVVKALCEVQTLREHHQLMKMSPESLTVKDGVVIISVLRRKATELNRTFGTDIWTPRMIDKVLWAVGRV